MNKFKKHSEQIKELKKINTELQEKITNQDSRISKLEK